MLRPLPGVVFYKTHPALPCRGKSLPKIFSGLARQDAHKNYLEPSRKTTGFYLRHLQMARLRAAGIGDNVAAPSRQQTHLLQVRPEATRVRHLTCQDFCFCPIMGHTSFFPLCSPAGAVSNLWRQSRKVAMGCRKKPSYNLLRLVSGHLVQAIELEGSGRSL